jgi:hypothetical protein
MFSFSNLRRVMTRNLNSMKTPTSRFTSQNSLTVNPTNMRNHLLIHSSQGRHQDYQKCRLF